MRVGIHTGAAEIVDANYVGLAVHIAARMSGIAHGGQVLLSDVTSELVDSLELLDHGEHRLKDIRTLVHVFQLLDPALRSSFPPLRSLTTVANNLPAPVDDFIGRRAELADIAAALEANRLVTLTGPGGSGKTRLAVETATRFAPRLPGGAWLVELTSTTDGERIDVLVASALGVVEHPDRPLRDSLLDSLADRELLLVLDNCEHLVDAAGSFAAAVLAACRGIRLLVTTRERLGIRGEQVLAVPPLWLPATDAPIEDSDAVQLFVARARAVSAAFDPDEQAYRAIASICRRVDGLPLAIELAAARVRALSLEQLAARLDDRFAVLADRDRTLEAVVTWSYDLLDDDERLLFRRLAMFPDTFSLEAAEAVGGGAPLCVAGVLDHLTALVDKSLVSTVSTAAGVERFQLLETLRDYGRHRLEELGEFDAQRATFIGWALGHVDALERAMRTRDQDETLRRVRPEHANLRAAMEWSLQSGDHLTALRIVNAVPVGTPSQRLGLIRQLLDDLPDAPQGVVGQALLTTATLEMERGAFAAAVEAGKRAEAAFEAAGDRLHAAWSRYFQTDSLWGVGDLKSVDDLCVRLVEEFRDLGSEVGTAYVSWLASARSEDPDRARELADAACDGFRAMGADLGLAHALEGRALTTLRWGNPLDAVVDITEALELVRSSGNPGCIAHSLEAVAACLAAVGQLTEVAELSGAAEAFREESGQEHRPWELRGYEEALRALGEGNAELDAARARGRNHSLASASERAASILASVSPS